MVRLNKAQATILTQIRLRREEYEQVVATARARIEEQVRAATWEAQGRVEDIMAEGSANGIPLRRLGQAYGSQDYATVKRLVQAGLSRRTEMVGVNDTVLSIADFIKVEPSPNHPSALRVTVTDAPAAVWTYVPQPGDVHAVYPTTWSGYMDVDAKTGEFSLISNTNSEVRGPLHLEWTRGHTAGTSKIREVLEHE